MELLIVYIFLFYFILTFDIWLFAARGHFYGDGSIVMNIYYLIVLSWSGTIDIL